MRAAQLLMAPTPMLRHFQVRLLCRPLCQCSMHLKSPTGSKPDMITHILSDIFDYHL